MGRSLGIGAPLTAWWGALRRHREPRRRVWIRLFLCACVAMLVGAAAAWRVVCAGPAYVGLRALWVAWALACGAVVASGLMLRSRLIADATPTNAVNAGIGAMVLLALWLAGYWLGHRG